MDKDCSEIQELLSGYLDHILSDEEEFEVEVHLAHCESCRDELHALMRISDTLSELKPIKAPDDFLASVKSKIEQSTVTTATPVENEIPAAIIPAQDEPVFEENIVEDKATEESVAPEVMTPNDMTAEQEIDVSPNKTIEILDRIIDFFRIVSKKPSYQAGFGLALVGICLMMFIQNTGMDKPIEMTARSDSNFETIEPEIDEYDLEDDAVPAVLAKNTITEAPSYVAADISTDSYGYAQSSSLGVLASENDIGIQNVQAFSRPAETEYIAEPEIKTIAKAATKSVTLAEKTPIKPKTVFKTKAVKTRSFSKALDAMSSEVADLSDNVISGASRSRSVRYGYSEALDDLDTSVSVALSDIEKEVLKSAISRADDELRDEYGYKDYFSSESLNGITVDDSELEDPMSLSIANDRNMVYINTSDPAHIVNMLRDKSTEMWLEEPIVNASELPYVVSFYVTGTVMERLLDECRAAGIDDMYMSFQFEADDYDQSALYYLQIDK